MIHSSTGAAPIADPKLLPIGSHADNTVGLSGIYDSTDANVAQLATQLTDFSARVPLALITPTRQKALLIAATPPQIYIWDSTLATVPLASFGGVTVTTSPFTTALNLQLAPKGTLVHEWGHVIDFDYLNHSGQDRSSHADWQAIQAVCFATGNLNGGANVGYVAPCLYYGWRNQVECFAEMFRMHWMGSGGGTPVQDSNADSDMMQLLYGPGSVYNPADSNIIAVHSIMNSLSPP